MNMMLASAEDVRELMGLIAEEERFRDAFAQEIERLELEIREKNRLFDEAARRLDEANENIARLRREMETARLAANDNAL